VRVDGLLDDLDLLRRMPTGYGRPPGEGARGSGAHDRWVPPYAVNPFWEE
jgi:hypothetical protein